MITKFCSLYLSLLYDSAVSNTNEFVFINTSYYRADHETQSEAEGRADLPALGTLSL